MNTDKSQAGNPAYNPRLAKHLTEVDTSFVQVIQEFDDKVRVFEIEDFHIGDMDDPLTTIVINGKYTDVPTPGVSPAKALGTIQEGDK